MDILAYVCKYVRMTAFTPHICKIRTYEKVEQFALGLDQVQILFAYMQILHLCKSWPCDSKAKIAFVSINLNVLKSV